MFYGISTLVGYLIPNLLFIISTGLNGSKYCYLTLKILFNINILLVLNAVIIPSKRANSSILPTNATLTGTTTTGQSGTESNVCKGVIHIPESSRTVASSSDALVSYQGHSLVVGSGLTPLQRCSQSIQQRQSIGKTNFWNIPSRCNG